MWVTVPSTSCPSRRWSTFFNQGSSCSWRNDKPIRLRSWSILMILTSTSSPTWSTSLGCWMRSHDISERCTNPSAPSMLTKAPKSATLVTRPWRTSPSSISSNNRSFNDSRVSCSAARSERIRRRRSRSTSITRTVISSPTIFPQR